MRRARSQPGLLFVCRCTPESFVEKGSRASEGRGEMSRNAIVKLVVLMVVLGTAAVLMGVDPWGPV